MDGDADIQKLVERSRVRRQQINEELQLVMAKENQTQIGAVKFDEKMPFIDDNYAIVDKTNKNGENMKKNLSKKNVGFYPLDELEELAKTATNTDNESAPGKSDDASAAADDDESTSSSTKVQRKIASSNFGFGSSQSVDSMTSSTLHEVVSRQARKARLAALSARIETFDEEDNSSCGSRRKVGHVTSSQDSIDSHSKTVQSTRFVENCKKFTSENAIFQAAPVTICPKSTRQRLYSTPAATVTLATPPLAQKRHLVNSPNTKHMHESGAKKLDLMENKIAWSRIATFDREVKTEKFRQQRENDVMEHSGLDTVAPSATVCLYGSTNSDAEQLHKLTEKRGVSKLMHRWEKATKEGLPLKPDESFTKSDDITAAALRVFAPKRPRQYQKNGNGVDASKKKFVETVVLAKTNSPGKSILRPDVQINKMTPTKNQTEVANLESSVEIPSCQEDTGNDSCGSELDNCLDEAINAATLNAQRKSSSRIEPDQFADSTQNSKMPADHICSPIKRTGDDRNRTIDSRGVGADGSTLLYYSALNDSELCQLPTSAVAGGPDPSASSMSSRLLHTVSQYRRLAREADGPSTPVRTVVLPPTSPADCASVAVGKFFRASAKSGDVFVRARDYDDKVQKLNELIKIQLEHILQASRALNLCRIKDEFRESDSAVDAHKVLLIAIERRKAYQGELDRISACRRNHRPLDNDPNEPLGTLTFSYMSMSLKREFVNDRINSLGEYVYHFVCLVKFRDQLMYTQSVDSDSAIKCGGRIEFSNYMNFTNIPHDFNVEISVFALQMKREEFGKEKFHTKAQTLRNKLRQTSSSSYSITPTSIGGPASVMDSNFKLIGQLNVTLGSISRQKFALQESLYEKVAGLASWRRFWCLLKGGVLRFWLYPDEEAVKEPGRVIDLTTSQTRVVEPVSLEICTRPNTFCIDVLNEKRDVERHLLSTDDREDFTLWAESINTALHNLHLWNVDL